MWASIEDDHTKRRLCSFLHYEAIEFLSVQYQSGADQANLTSCLCPHGPRTYNSNWISLNTCKPMPSTDSWSSLPSSHVGRQVQNWNHHHWSHVVFDDEARSNCITLILVPFEFHLCLGCSNPLVFQQHDEKLRHAHYGCRGWLGTSQQIPLETSAGGSSSGAVCQHEGALVMIKGHRPGVLSCYSTNIFGPCRQKHRVEFVWSAPSWPQTLIINFVASWYEGYGLLLTLSSSIDACVAPG